MFLEQNKTAFNISITKAKSEVPTQCLIISLIFPHTQTPFRGIPKFSCRRSVLCSALMHTPTSPALASWKRLRGVSALRGCSANTVIQCLLCLLLAHLLPERYGFCTEVSHLPERTREKCICLPLNAILPCSSNSCGAIWEKEVFPRLEHTFHLFWRKPLSALLVRNTPSPHFLHLKQCSVDSPLPSSTKPNHTPRLAGINALQHTDIPVDLISPFLQSLLSVLWPLHCLGHP